MKEAYVSYEVAKLLKDKGFDWDVFTFYETSHKFNRANTAYNWNNANFDVDVFSMPTQQMVCRWLREEHNILVAVQPCELGPGVDDYTYVIYEIQPEDYHFKFIEQGRMQPVAYTMDYEGTLEEGIKHALTNLI